MLIVRKYNLYYLFNTYMFLYYDFNFCFSLNVIMLVSVYQGESHLSRHTKDLVSLATRKSPFTAFLQLSLQVCTFLFFHFLSRNALLE